MPRHESTSKRVSASKIKHHVQNTISNNADSLALQINIVPLVERMPKRSPAAHPLGTRVT